MAESIDATAERAGLGALRMTFRPTRRLTWEERKTADKVGLVIVLLILCGVMGAIVIGLIVSVPVVGLCVLAVLLGVFALNAGRRKAHAQANVGRELRIYEHGVGVVGTGGETMKAYRWADMSVLQKITKHYRNGAYTHTTHEYTLSGPGAEATRLNGGLIGTFSDPERWGNEIQYGVTSAQLPPALAAVHAGRTLEFGGFTVDAVRLTAGGKSVAWSQVQQIKTERGYLSVRQEGRWLNMTTRAVSQIPNFFVFRALADYLAESARANG